MPGAMARRGLLSSQLRAMVPDSEKNFMRSKRKVFRHGVDVESRFGSQTCVSTSSGSEHEVCLSAMVDSFIENGPRCSCRLSASTTSCDCEDSRSLLGGELHEILRGLAPCTSAAEQVLLAAVKEAGHDATKRQVMARLRTRGYDAAICKSRWEGSPGGAYEYIDVVLDGASERILIDTEFRALFEIARPSSRYTAVAQALPAVFVGRVERLMAMVNVMAEAAKQSLKQSGLEVPPWRKPEYMRKKWLSSYRRTTKSDGSDHHEESLDQVTTLVEAKKQNVAAMVNNSEWTPPALKPRVVQQCRGPAGLTCILRESGLMSSLRSSIEAQRRSLPIAI